MFGVDGERCDEGWDGGAEDWVGTWWSVGEGSSGGVFAVRVILEVEVFHDWGGVVRGGCAAKGVLVDDGDAPSVLVGSVSVRYLVAVMGSGGNVWRGGGV